MWNYISLEGLFKEFSLNLRKSPITIKMFYAVPKLTGFQQMFLNHTGLEGEDPRPDTMATNNRLFIPCRTVVQYCSDHDLLL